VETAASKLAPDLVKPFIGSLRPASAVSRRTRAACLLELNKKTTAAVRSLPLRMKSCGRGLQSVFDPYCPTISIRKDNAWNRTTGACTKVLYKQRMISSTCLLLRARSAAAVAPNTAICGQPRCLILWLHSLALHEAHLLDREFESLSTAMRRSHFFPWPQVVSPR
jgi:hypothetical protein